MLRQSWWKILCVLLLFYTVIAGLLGGVPAIPILHETIRNLYFHVAMWFSMMILFIVSVIYAVKYLRKPHQLFDIYSLEYAKAGIVFGALGLLTGSEWAGFTWNAFWSNDPKQLGAVLALLIYLAYLVLRNSVTDMDKRARLGSVYNIFAFAMLFPSLWIVPRMVQSLHPGGMGSNPAFENIDPRMAKIFWLAAIPGWTLLGVWITSLRVRLQIIDQKRQHHA